MAKKLRINVVCSSRDKRFLVLAEREWELATLRKHAEDVFHSLYPEEPELRISGLQNEFHFDLPQSYKVDEALIDTGLVFVIEKEVSLLKSLSQSAETNSNRDTRRQYNIQTDRKSRDDSTQPSPRKRKKLVKKTTGLMKIPTSQTDRITDISSSNRVTSTTSPTVAEQEASLMPQIVEKISEDSEVDVESVDDSAPQTLQRASNNVAMHRKATGRKTSQQLLRKARKMKNKTKTSTKHTTRSNR